MPDQEKTRPSCAGQPGSHQSRRPKPITARADCADDHEETDRVPSLATIWAGDVQSVSAEFSTTSVEKLIQERVRRRLLDSRVDAEEVIGTLVSQMRGNVLDLLDERGALDLKRAREMGLGHLIKKISIVRRATRPKATVKRPSRTAAGNRGDQSRDQRQSESQDATLTQDPCLDSSPEPTEAPTDELVTTTFEFHSQQSAAAQLCKVLGIARAAKEQQSSSSRFVPYFRYALERALADAEAIGLQVTREEVFERLAEAEEKISGFDLRKHKAEVIG